MAGPSGVSKGLGPRLKEGSLVRKCAGAQEGAAELYVSGRVDLDLAGACCVVDAYALDWQVGADPKFSVAC